MPAPPIILDLKFTAQNDRREHRRQHGHWAGSVVTCDVPATCVAVGNPCRVLRELPA